MAFAEAFIESFLAGREHLRQQKQMELQQQEHELRKQQLQHQMGQLKIAEKVKARDAALEQFKLLTGQPAASFPQDYSAMQNKVESPVPGGGVPSPDLLTGHPGFGTQVPQQGMVQARPQPVNFPGIEEWGVPGFSMTPQTREQVRGQKRQDTLEDALMKFHEVSPGASLVGPTLDNQGNVTGMDALYTAPGRASTGGRQFGADAYIRGKYGDNPTPDQILEGETEFSQANDDPILREQRQFKLEQEKASLAAMNAIPDEWKFPIRRAVMSVPAYRQGEQRKLMVDAYQSGDMEELRGIIIQAATESEQAETKKGILGRNEAVLALKDIRSMMEELEKKGVDTNIFQGKFEKLAQWAGTTSNPELAELGVRITDAYVRYRQSLTGAQFGEAEAKEYRSMFPDFINTLELNKAKIRGLERAMATRHNTYWKYKLGPKGAQLVGLLGESGGSASTPTTPTTPAATTVPSKPKNPFRP